MPFFIPCDPLFQSLDAPIDPSPDIHTSHDSAPFIIMPSSCPSLGTSNDAYVLSVLPFDSGAIRYVPNESTIVPLTQPLAPIILSVTIPGSTSSTTFVNPFPSSVSHIPASSSALVSIHSMLTMSEFAHQLPSSYSSQPPTSTHPMITRSQASSLQALTAFCHPSIDLVNKEPISVHEALLYPLWVVVLYEEMNALLDNHT